ncbi:MAG TPA: MaoC family dehydratase N-terminal domain-containing protein [Burkholderiaceae bacterium]|nr:MaoC family dehydratase N-terminal domain-containing protein [Burkholderiaceae bacterium]
MAPASDETVVPPEARAMIGRVRERSHLVTALDIRKFAQAIGETNPIHRDPEAARAAGHRDVVAPPLFFQTMVFDPVAAEALPPDGSPTELDVPVPATRAMGGSSEFTINRPVCAGEWIRVRSVLKDVQVKRGKAGVLYAIVVQTDFSDADDALVARETATYLKRP